MSDDSKALQTQLQTVRGWLEGQTTELAKVLPKAMQPERFARIALTQVLRNPELARCDKASFVLAIMEAAALGLEPDSQSGLAYLVPFKGRVQLIVGYLGMIQLAHRHPKVKQVMAEAVYDKDELSVEYGIRPVLIHRPVFGPGGRGEFQGAYAWALLAGGARPFVYLTRDDIEAHRARSRAKDSGPWLTDYEAMAKKTAVRQLRKWLPLSPELMQALASEDEPDAERPAPPLYVPSGTAVETVLDAIANQPNVEATGTGNAHELRSVTEPAP